MPREVVFDHDRLEVYQLSREATREIAGIWRSLKPGTGELVDQLKRASLSVSLNIAEGAGDASTREKARFYTMASRSARECAAVLDHLVDLELSTQARVAPARALLGRIAAMLHKLIRSQIGPPPRSR